MPTHPAHDCSTPISPASNPTVSSHGAVIATMRAALIAADSRIEPATASVPALPARGALLRVIGCSICGSDLDKIVHRKATPGTVLGHEVVGRIIELALDAPCGWAVGDRLVVSHHVPCRVCHYCHNGSEPMCRAFKQTNLDPGGFAEIVALSEKHLQHTAFAIPNGVDNETASCVEPLACVLRAIRRGHSQSNKGNEPGTQSVLIAGLGFIGLLAAQVYQHQGIAVTGVDIDPQRLAWAREKGLVPQAFHPVNELTDLKRHLSETTPLGQADIVFLTAVNAASIALALEAVREGGTIILFASGGATVAFDAQTLYFREISVIPSYSPELQDLQAAAQMLFANIINANALVSHQMPLSEITEAVEQYRTGQARKVFIEIEQSKGA
jgi:L-iditol 2-dehydrogenase